MQGFPQGFMPPGFGGQPQQPGLIPPAPYTPGQGYTAQGLGGPGPASQPAQQGLIPQAAPGMDRASQGVGEQYVDRTMGAAFAPTGSEQYANQVAGRFNAPRNFQPGGGGATNRAEEAYQDYRSSGLQAGLDPYYDRAKQKTSTDIDKALAARGMHGSSAGLQQVSDAMSGLNAEQANREGDFDLQRLGLGGQLGRSADISSMGGAEHDLQRSLAGQGAELDWLRTGADIAGQGDRGLLGRLGYGLQASGAGQGMREDRLQNAFNNTLIPSQLAMQNANNYYGQMFAADQGLTDAATAAQLGIPNQQLQQGYRAQDQQASGLGGILGGILGLVGL